MKQLPEGLIEYDRTGEFDEATTPASFLENTHSTKPGVWCRVRILEGTLDYRILEPTEIDHILTPEQPGIVEPEVRHAFALRGPVRFVVEFLRGAEAGGP